MAIQDLTASLDLKQNLNIYATCKQFDSLNLILNIYDNSLQANLSNYNIRLRAMKADKVPLIQENIGITISGNVTTIEAHEQLTTTAGNTPIELQFIDKTTGKKKTTFNLVLVVVASTVAIDASISTATYTLLEELENKLDQASDFFENIDSAITANNNLINSTNTANQTREALDNSNETALNTKSALDTSNTNATNTKNALNTSITNANNSKNALDTSKSNADDSKTALDASIVNANTFVSEHGDIIDLDNRVTENTNSIDSINTSLSEMANKSDLTSEILSRTNNDANLQSQINAISLQGTSGDSSAEVAQARVNVSGVIFSTVKDRLDNSEKSFKNYIDKKYLYDWVAKSVSGTDGTTFVSTTRICTDSIQYAESDLTIILSDASLYKYGYILYSDASGTFISNHGWQLTPITIPSGSFFRIVIAYADDTTISDILSLAYNAININFLDDFKSIGNQWGGVECGYNNKFPNIDSVNNTISFYKDTIIHDGNFVYTIPSDVTLSLIPNTNSSTFGIFFDKKNKKFESKYIFDIVNQNYILLMYGRNNHFESIVSIFDYTINGYNLKWVKESAQFYDSWTQLEIIESYNQTTSLAIKLGYLVGRGSLNLNNTWSVDDTTNSISSIKTIVGSTYFNDSGYMLLPSGYSFIYDLLSKSYKILDRGSVVGLYQIILAECINGIALKGYLISQFINSKISKNQMMSSEGTDLATFETFSQSIQEIQNDKLTLGVQTDTHYYRQNWQRQSLNDCANLSNWISLDAILNLGDLIRGYEDRTMKTMKLDMTYAVKDYLEKAKCPVLLTKGNHDDGSLYVYNSGSKSALDTITPDLMYNRMVKPLERYGIIRNTSDTNSLYYYYDIPQFKTRIIILNVIDIPYENNASNIMKYRGQWDYAYRNDQINWIANTALKNLESSWMVIIGTHIALDSTLWTESIVPKNNDIMYNVIKAFKNGTSYTGSSTITDHSVNVSCDYTSSGSHDVIVLSGHTHAVNTSYTDNIRHIIFGEYFSTVKSDVMMIDRTNKKAIIKTFNYSNDREYTY